MVPNHCYDHVVHNHRSISAVNPGTAAHHGDIRPKNSIPGGESHLEPPGLRSLGGRWLKLTFFMVIPAYINIAESIKHIQLLEIRFLDICGKCGESRGGGMFDQITIT